MLCFSSRAAAWIWQSADAAKPTHRQQNRGAMNQAQDESPSGMVAKARYKLCPSCGNFVGYPEKDIFCTVCGVRFIVACSRCREPILSPFARFCPACGQALVKLERNEPRTPL
jgi:membrane protease subunit (stomatin/prohibitin family)